MASLVFHDPSGRRGRRAGLALGLLLAGVFAILSAFVATLAIAPRIPSLAFHNPHVLTSLSVAEAPGRSHAVWTRVPRPTGPLGSHAKPLNIGFYVSWDEMSRESLADHVNQLDIVAPQWVLLKNAAGDVDITSDPRADKLIASAAHRPAVMPLIYNASDKLWDGKTADAVLTSPVARAHLISSLADLAAKRGYAGYMFDLENMSAKGLAAYPGFIAQANAAFNASGREVWVTAPFDDSAWPVKALGKAADTLVLMAYDEHYWTGGAGPAASQGWYEKNLARTFKGLSPDKTVVALGAFGYDWSKGGKADGVTFHEATLEAHDSDARISFDPSALNPTFGYADEAGVAHTVWFLDAATLFNQVKVADAWRPRGYALWRMGSEDPGVWKVLGQPYGAAKTAPLQQMAPSPDVDFNGTGEILNPTATPTPGFRTLTTDPHSGLITGERFDKIPTAYVVQRAAAPTRAEVALTFDDGPDATLDAEDPQHPQGQARPRHLLRHRREHAGAAGPGEAGGSRGPTGG